MSQNKLDNLKLDCGAENFEALHPALKNALTAAASEYMATVTGATPLIITSARRTLLRQAQLMAEMTPQQLHSMYCSNGTPSYITQICNAYPADPETIHNILKNRTEGYISRHLYGLAADIAAENLSQPEKLKEILLKHGAVAVLDERDMGIQCFHVSWKE